VAIANIHLYHFPGFRSVRVAWLLHELGQPFEATPVQLLKGEQYSPAFRALNPGHSVPVMEFETSDGSKVTMVESGAIVSMLADLWPEANLAPPVSDLTRRSAYLQAIHYCGATLDMMLWQIRVHEDLLTRDQRDARSADRYRAKFAAEVEPNLATRLSVHEYACGNEFSAADCMLAHDVIWARTYGMCASTPFDAYLQRVTDRTAYQRAFSDTLDMGPQPESLDHLRDLFNG
jgi:glutathione S-transferase